MVFVLSAVVAIGLVAVDQLPEPSVRLSSILASGVGASNVQISPNDNRIPAGRASGRARVIRLEAREGEWRPEPNGPGLAVFAFAEAGRSPQIPGPLIRVAAGTEVRVVIHNTLSKPLLMRGLQDRTAAVLDSVDIAPDSTREFVFRPIAPGTYYYWGRTEGSRVRFGVGIDSQLLGAIVVDPPGGASTDRIWVMGLWINPVAGSAMHETMVMNGLSWPHTERMAQTVGDTVQWRVINGMGRAHPMHLHGFYFTINSRGRAAADTIYTKESRRLAVTELMDGGGTMTFTWIPSRAGNWLFHCHLIAHISPALRLTHSKPTNDTHAMNHALDGMAGLVVGIHVRQRPGIPEVATDPVARRKLRLFVNQRANMYGDLPAYSYVLQEGPLPPAPDSLRIPGSPVILTRGEPTEITVVNRTSRPATVHWHGIELESFYDGVADWSGWGTRTAPPVAPGDSFIVRMTPDRAGTFIYHTHSEEGPQLASGLYGPLLVLEPGSVRDTEIERILLLGIGGPGLDAAPVVNGATEPPPLELKVGRTYRFRFINITPSHFRDVRLLAGTSVVDWRPFAKDGADLPAHQATTRPALVRLGSGETYDFEFTPADPGTLALEIISTGLGRPARRMIVPVNVAR